MLLGGPDTASELAQIPVGAIQPHARQPRRRFDAEALEGLAESIRAQGVVQPIAVRPLGEGRYELIAGERRWRAARAAGLALVPAIVRETDDRESLLLALVENVAREDLSAVEEARAYAVLQDEFSLSLGDISDRVGRSKPTVSNRLRLLELPDDVLALVERQALSEGHARAILAVPENEGRRQLAREVLRHGLSVRATERKARFAGARSRPRRTAAAALDPTLVARAKAALAALTGVSASVRRSRIELPFADETALAELVESLERASLLDRPSLH